MPTEDKKKGWYLLSTFHRIPMHRGMARANLLSIIGLFQHNHKQSLKPACILKRAIFRTRPSCQKLKECLKTSLYCSSLICNLVLQTPF